MSQSVEAPKGPETLPAPCEIVIKETGTLVAYACPGKKCGQLFLFSSRDTEEDKKRKHDEASTHCVKTCSCGRPIDYHYRLKCAHCRAEQEREKEQRAFDRAAKVSIDDYPDHPIFWEGRSGDMGGDGYFSGIDALCDYCEQEGIELPSYVWACERREFKISAHDLIERELERQDIDPEATVLSESAYAELQQHLNTWIAGNAGKLHGWFQDMSRAVILREAEEKG